MSGDKLIILRKITKKKLSKKPCESINKHISSRIAVNEY